MYIYVCYMSVIYVCVYIVDNQDSKYTACFFAAVFGVFSL